MWFQNLMAQAISLIYEHGNLITAATRGNGTVGEDVSQNVKTIKSIPHKLKQSQNFHIPDYIEIRGEIFITKKNFENLNYVAKKKKQKFLPIQEMQHLEVCVSWIQILLQKDH